MPGVAGAGRENIPSGRRWEDIVGNSRAVRMSNHVYVSGMTAVALDGRIVGEGDAYAQTMQVFCKIEATPMKATARVSPP